MCRDAHSLEHYSIGGVVAVKAVKATAQPTHCEIHMVDEQIAFLTFNLKALSLPLPTSRLSDFRPRSCLQLT